MIGIPHHTGDKQRLAGEIGKRAVVVIHGIGNQSPMATLREFVESAWTSHKGLVIPPPPRTWAKKDLISNNCELRRITTNRDTSHRRTDFFEFYWADQMEDTQGADVVWWLKRLFWRWLDRVPPTLRETWIAGMVALSAVSVAFAGFVWTALEMLQVVSRSTPRAFALAAALSIATMIVWWLRRRVLVQVVGDAARYLTPSPQNIAARSRIRTLGLKLLTELHDDKRYDRVIVVGHSLGSVIGYDILNFYWSNINTGVKHAGNDDALKALEGCIGALRRSPDDPAALHSYRVAQRRYAETLPQKAWKVTDFVTLGSPLTHAAVLMVNDRDKLLPSDETAIKAGWLAEWRRRLDPKTAKVSEVFFARVSQREFPMCPPVSEKGDSFTYTEGGDVIPHHAAVFAPVRWTNIFAPCRHVLWGDVIGGPIAPVFGPGVKDVPLTGEVGRMLFAHTHYWDQGRTDDEHLTELRTAINLLDGDESV